MAGRGGDAYTVTAHTSWKLDFSGSTIRGGAHYAGMALELLGRPANDGLSTLLVKLPNRMNGPAVRTTVLGAVSGTMPAGRYLLVVLGDRPVEVSVPLVGAARVTAPKRTGTRAVAFGQEQGVPSYAPQPTGLYDARLTLPLPAVNDPIVMTNFVVHDAGGPHTEDSIACVRHGGGRCSPADGPAFGTGNQQFSGSGQTMEEQEFWDGVDGLTHATGWAEEADYRASADGAHLYAAYALVSGANR